MDFEKTWLYYSHQALRKVDADGVADNNEGKDVVHTNAIRRHSLTTILNLSSCRITDSATVIIGNYSQGQNRYVYPEKLSRMHRRNLIKQWQWLVFNLHQATTVCHDALQQLDRKRQWHDATAGIRFAIHWSILFVWLLSCTIVREWEYERLLCNGAHDALQQICRQGGWYCRPTWSIICILTMLFLTHFL